MTKLLLGTAVFLVAATASVQAQTCQGNFKVEGTPLLTSLNYKSSQIFPRTSTAKAFDNVTRAVAAEGFSNLRIDKALGSISAVQETSGSGRPQTFRAVVRKAGAGARVDVVFTVQPGQVAPEEITRDAICRVIGSASS